MKFSIRCREGGEWAVVNERDEVLFTGSLRDCEEWLDHEQNLARPRAGWMHRLRQWFQRLLHRGHE